MWVEFFAGRLNNIKTKTVNAVARRINRSAAQLYHIGTLERTRWCRFCGVGLHFSCAQRRHAKHTEPQSAVTNCFRNCIERIGRSKFGIAAPRRLRGQPWSYRFRHNFCWLHAKPWQCRYLTTQSKKKDALF